MNGLCHYCGKESIEIWRWRSDVTWTFCPSCYKRLERKEKDFLLKLCPSKRSLPIEIIIELLYEDSYLHKLNSVRS